MSIYKELGVRPIINAAGTYTVLGGSRMSGETLSAMTQAAESFVQIRQFQQAINRELAVLTHNEAAYVTGGAAAGLYLAVAAAIQKKHGCRFYYLTRKEISSYNIVMFKAHRNPYDLVIKQLGADYQEISFPNAIFPPTREELIRAINDKTAALYYALAGWTPAGDMPYAEVFQIAAERGVPVIVDAAAQLPPVENLWKISDAGADAVLFSGGKDLRGPQSSGLMVGKKSLLDEVQSLGFPNYGIGRMLKVGREEMAGLYSAVKQYVSMDHQGRTNWCEEQIKKLSDALKENSLFGVKRSYPNEAGQPIARAYVSIRDGQEDAGNVCKKLLESDPSIFVMKEEKGFYVNPMTLYEGETELIIERLIEIQREYDKGDR